MRYLIYSSRSFYFWILLVDSDCYSKLFLSGIVFRKFYTLFNEVVFLIGSVVDPNTLNLDPDPELNNQVWKQKNYCKKRQKRLTLRARLRFLENSDQCIKFTSCSSFYAWSWSNPCKTWPWRSSQSIAILLRKAQMRRVPWSGMLVFKDRWGGLVFVRYFASFMVKTKFFWSSYKIQKERSYNLWPGHIRFLKNI